MRKRLLFVSLLLLGLAGCGHKGPLYLPAAKSAPPQPQNIITPDPERPAPPQTVPPPK